MSQERNPQGIRIPPTGLNTTRRHRTFDERLVVRFPALSQLAGAFVFRLPMRSRLRRRLLRRRIAQAASAVNRRDFDLLLTGFDPEFDWHIAAGAGAVPELVGHHHGHAAYLEVWRHMLEPFDDLTAEPEELIDAGHRLFSVTRMSGHGTGSGAPVSQRLFQVLTLRRGLVVKEEDFASREEAFEAAGLSE